MYHILPQMSRIPWCQEIPGNELKELCSNLRAVLEMKGWMLGAETPSHCPLLNHAELKVSAGFPAYPIASHSIHSSSNSMTFYDDDDLYDFISPWSDKVIICVLDLCGWSGSTWAAWEGLGMRQLATACLQPGVTTTEVTIDIYRYLTDTYNYCKRHYQY